MSGKAGAPVSGEAGAPVSGEAGAPVSGEAGAPVSGEAGVPVSGEAGVPVSGEAGVPVSDKKEWPVSGAALLTAARACYGAMLLAAPRRVIGIVAPEPPSTRAVAVIRVLGARHLVQAALTAATLSATPAPARAMPPEAMLAEAILAKAILAKAAPDGIEPRAALRAGAAVDTLHAASMVALALAARKLRRAAGADAALEAGLASFGIITARRQPHR